MSPVVISKAAVRARDENVVLAQCEGVLRSALRGMRPFPPLEWDDLRQAASLEIVKELRRYKGDPADFYKSAVGAARRGVIDLIRQVAGRHGHKVAHTVELHSLAVPAGGADVVDKVAVREAMGRLRYIRPRRAEQVVRRLAGCPTPKQEFHAREGLRDIVEGRVAPEHRMRRGSVLVDGLRFERRSDVAMEALRVRPNAEILGMHGDIMQGRQVWRVQVQEPVGAG